MSEWCKIVGQINREKYNDLTLINLACYCIKNRKHKNAIAHCVLHQESGAKSFFQG